MDFTFRVKNTKPRTPQPDLDKLDDPRICDNFNTIYENKLDGTSEIEQDVTELLRRMFNEEEPRQSTDAQAKETELEVSEFLRRMFDDRPQVEIDHQSMIVALILRSTFIAAPWQRASQ